eukprot:TRINITY_DN6726_c0_g1_i1.p1 TRINITY_DN6726_c0_g1~~TRINITY_DN6726_c0_g1_i1.p1  ORF type:complete len:172 (+),score=31.60 TRINITY_DN6726_c0_g1_i1:46-561(+)
MASQMTFCFLAALCVGLAQGKGIVVFKAAEQKLGVFYMGRQDLADSGDTQKQPASYEVFLGTVSPHEEFAVHFNEFDAFDIRAADMTSRSRVITYMNSDAETKSFHPLKLTIRNFMSEGGKLELKHGGDGFIWIEPDHQVTHSTYAQAVFELRDSTKTPFAFVRLDMSSEL